MKWLMVFCICSVDERQMLAELNSALATGSRALKDTMRGAAKPRPATVEQAVGPYSYAKSIKHLAGFFHDHLRLSVRGSRRSKLPVSLH
jgi:hypothetical protein